MRAKLLSPIPLGDRMKRYELAEAGRYMISGLPVIARLDGRCFHTWTRSLQRPFDLNLQACMLAAMSALVDDFHAEVGYTQSDEITLAWCQPTMFDGRYQKYCSVLASVCTAWFNKTAATFLPHLPPATFDCRVWQVPSVEEAFNAILWRERDATKNSIQMAARSMYSDRDLIGKSGSEMQEMLHAKGINWNDYPVAFKRGVYAQRMPIEVALTPEELAAIPEKHRPSGPVVRYCVRTLDMPKLTFSAENVRKLFPSLVEDEEYT